MSTFNLNAGNRMRVLITGGAGYIGSLACLACVRAGYEVCIVDDLSNGYLEAVGRLRRLSNKKIKFFKNNVCDQKAIDAVFKDFMPDAVIHFAGLKSVEESLKNPKLYHNVNVGGTHVILKAMDKYGCKKIVFSSSATVYGKPVYLPCDEKHPTKPINPYGTSKLESEILLEDWANVSNERRAVALRYFNPVGADASGEIGEHSDGKPNNIMPIIAQAAKGRRSYVNVYGDDYDTFDGTGVRDYIHVTDLARAHLRALEEMESLNSFEKINIGRGSGISVLEIIQSFEKVSHVKIPVVFSDRRPGDAPSVWADVQVSKHKLQFETEFDIEKMCGDVWNWEQSNPNGYE